MLTRKHYKAIARIVNNHRIPQGAEYNPLIDARNVGANDFARTPCNYFAADNPRFDRARFLKACGLEG